MTRELPIGWRRVKIARCFDLIGSGTTPKSHMQNYYEGNIPWLQSGDLHGRYIDKTAKCVSEEALRDCNLRVYKAPFIAIAMYGASIANVSNVRIDTCTNQACCVLCNPRPNVLPNYLYYSLQEARESMLVAAHGGTQPNISREVVRRLQILLPPLPEQKRIAAFLDAKCADIDKAIAAKRKQLDLLEEMWKNILYRATTQGVENTVYPQGLKRTGNSLFPVIPSNWSVKRIKGIASIRYGLGEPPEESDDGKPMIRATDFHAGKIDDSKMLHVNVSDLPQGKDPYLHAGEIIIVRSGAYAGDSTIIPRCYDGYVSGYDMVLTVTKAVPEFVAYAFLSKHLLNDQLLLLSSRAAQPHVNAEQVLNLVLPLPPKEIQKDIVAYLDAKRKNLDELTDNLRRQINVLEQYRKSLIHECVMGERRV